MKLRPITMTAEEKIATLILHGCGIYAVPTVSDPVVLRRERFITLAGNKLPNSALMLGYLNVGRQKYKWVYRVCNTGALHEISFYDTGLIDQLSVVLIEQFIHPTTTR